MDSNFQYASVVKLVVAPLPRPALAAQQFAERLGDNRVRQDDRHAKREERLAMPLGEADAIEQDRVVARACSTLPA